jgi:hypothetical protein
LDDAGFFQAMHPLGCRRRGQSKSFSKVGPGDPALGLEQG